MDYVVFPFEKFVSCITTEYDVQADSILALYIEIAKYLRDNPIVSGLTVKEIIDRYLEENPPSAGVVSVNGKTGAVTGLYDAENPPPYPVTSVNGKTGDVVIEEGGGVSGVTSVNGKTGAVTGLYDADNQPPYPVRSVNGKTGDVTGLYDESNQPPYPVTSVNGKTGNVTGLYDSENQPPYPVTSVDGKTGKINSVKIIYGGAYPVSIGQKTGIVVFTTNISGGSLSVGRTVTYEILFDEPYPVPISAAFLDGGYGLQISITRSSTSKSFYVNITNHGFEGEIPLSGMIVVAFIPNGATSITGVNNA